MGGIRISLSVLIFGVISSLLGIHTWAQVSPSANALTSPGSAVSTQPVHEFDLPLEEEMPVAMNDPSAPAVPAGAAGGLDLSAILDLACRQSPRLSVQRANLTASQMQAMATGLLPNPTVEGGVKKVSGDGSGPLLSISQELPVNGALGLERQAANLEYSADRAALSREVQTVLSEIQTAYVHVLAVLALSGVEQHGLEVAGSSLKLVSETLKAGLVSPLPYNLALAEYSNARTTHMLAQRESLLAREELAALLGMTGESLPMIAGDLRQSLLPTDMDPSRRNRGDLQAANLRIQAAQTSVAAADRARIPNPVVGYSREEAGDDTENFFTIGLEVPVFNNKRPEVYHRQAKQQAAVNEKSALVKSIDAEVDQAAIRLEAKRDAVRIYETEVQPSIQKSLESANLAFQSGTTDLSLLLQTQTRLIEQERNTIRSLEELRKAEIAYLLALGTVRDR
jgi:outer membrane protein TolC